MIIKGRLSELWDGTDVLDSLWRVLGSPQVTILLFVALAVVIILGMLIPQRPTSASSDPVAESLWLTSLRAKYGGIADGLVQLGVFDLYRSFWLRGLLGLLALNLVLGWVELAHPRYRLRVPVPLTSGQKEVRQYAQGPIRWVEIPLGVLPAPQTVDLWRERIQARLRADRHRLIGSVDRDVMYADRFTLLPMLVYLGLLLILAGLLLSEHTAWWEEGVLFRPGQVRPVGHGTGLALRADAIEADYDPVSGRLRGARTELTFLRAGGPVGRDFLYDHAPSLYAGLLLYQTSTEPVLLVQAQDTGGKSLALGTPETGAAQFAEVTLRFREETAARFIVVLDLTTRATPPTTGGPVGRQFEERGNEGYVLVPSRDLSLRLRYASPEAAGGTAVFQVEAFRGAESIPFYQAQFTGEAVLEIEGDRYRFIPQRHAVVKFGQDYAIVLVLLGAAIVLVAGSLSVWQRPRRLWVIVRPVRGEARLLLIAEGIAPGQSGKWFDALTQGFQTLSAESGVR